MIIKPLLFKPAMVRATLREIEASGTGKWQTRRHAWREPSDDFLEYVGQVGAGVPGRIEHKPTEWKKLYDAWTAGERDVRIWVRETWAEDTAVRSRGRHGPPDIHYRADRRPTFESASGHITSAEMINGYLDAQTWRPSIHMPRAYSRITLEVTDVRMERLNSINEDDAIAEGVEWRDGCYGVWRADGSMLCGGSSDARQAFRCLWLNIHGAGAWEANPEIVAVGYIPHLKNIDSFVKEAA